ncbi:MAG: HEAT repeat domain-containing protein [Actinobacteria bacterium]|nr:HEAT repeat domain-containing protein [Actinomycetota bacterium]
MKDRMAPSADRQSVGKICTAMHHAYRGLRLFPADHPSARGSIDTLVGSVTSHVTSMGSVHLQIDEMRVLYENEQVYSYEGSRDNLAFLMFRDGIRALSFHPDVEPWEIEALVDVLSHADDLADLDHDLATTLWERELIHIDHEVVDPFLTGGGELRGEAVEELRETVTRRLGELSPADVAVGLSGGGGLGVAGEGGGGAEDGLAGPGTGALQAEDSALSQEDMDLIEQMVADSSRVLDDFTIILLEIIGADFDRPEGDDEPARALSMVCQQYIDLGNVDGLTVVLERLEALEREGRRPAGFASGMVGAAVTPARLAGLIERMTQTSSEETARMERLLRRIRGWIYPALLETLVENNDKSVRKTVLALLRTGSGIPVQYIWPLMHDTRWYVVRNAVQLARGSDDPELPIQLERLLRHPDERVRREVIRSLDVIGGSRAAPLLLKVLWDEDSAVRTLAVRSLSRHGNRGHFASVSAQVEAREFETRPSEELEAFLEAFALLGGEITVATLDKMWKKRFFRTRPLPLRLAAVQALGLIPTRTARDALGEASKSGDAQVRKAAVRALAQGQSRSGEARP